MLRKIMNICIILICLMITKSFANTTGTVYLNTNKEIVEIGEEIEVTINIENIKTAAFTAYINFDDTKFEYISGTENTNVIGNRVITLWFDQLGGKQAKTGELIKLKFKAKANGLANFVVSGQFYSENGQLIETDFKELQVEVGKKETKLTSDEQGTDTNKSNADLKSLRVDIEGIVPTFDKNVKQYYLNIQNTINNIDVLAVAENPKSSIEITGNTNLKDGLNVISIKVVSEDKTQENIYNINVTKTANLDTANTNLETLAIENVLLNPPFDNTITHYDIEISNSTTQLNILAVSENENASTSISGNNDLKEGNNQIVISVTASNGFTKKYFIINAYKRNVQEEEQFINEQEMQQKKLEEAYEIEQTSKVEENISEEANNNKWYIIGGIIVTIIVISIIGIIYFKKKKSGNN
mgnify:FL=1